MLQMARLMSAASSMQYDAENPGSLDSDLPQAGISLARFREVFECLENARQSLKKSATDRSFVLCLLLVYALSARQTSCTISIDVIASFIQLGLGKTSLVFLLQFFT